MKTIALRVPSLLLPGVLFLFLSTPAQAEEGASVDETELIKVLRQRAAPMYERFSGVSSLRTVTTREFKLGQARPRFTKVMEAEVIEPFYSSPRRKILSCLVDGSKASERECEGRGQSEPVQPLFDKDSAIHYDFKLAGRKTVGKVACLKLKVIPRKSSPRHFSGHLYVAADTHFPVLLDGTLAKLPFPLKRFRLKLSFGRHEGFAVAASGTIDVEVKVAFFYHARIVSQFVAREHKLLPR